MKTMRRNNIQSHSLLALRMQGMARAIRAKARQASRDQTDDERKAQNELDDLALAHSRQSMMTGDELILVRPM